MDMDQAAVFLAGSVLTVMGFLVILGGVVVANNIIHKYWKSFGWSLVPGWTHEPVRFAEPHDMKEPTHAEHQEKRNERS